ncbi:hypothetical protein TRM7557_01606 [Tritonibacter multivorans]|uniref:Cytochrome b561 domain-containing protein n=1 Tax=Tritonibacter multivorans TaxID=928856 RepID=A0A0P1G8M9_9RHOB|nr:cytochrome b561 domain-containing protein [Tritonibacter multivorans]MDA7422245.1 cytochrome b561 domain-containing protein [Tritonibacter multivorans]CUH77830.1 hypothetical protein TRM7557_01606 [Tritonibacter multivorans]SFD11134.1 cytochrome b561 [Tritonibacter multivorans]
MEWLLSPIDPSRAHDVGFAISWHARTMTLAWGVMVPAAIFAARYFKILPGQDWPRELDSQVWWRGHWMGQALAYLLTLLGLGLILGDDSAHFAPIHRILGYVVLGLGSVQVLLGVFRGSKGGPTAPARDGSLRGDHYDMTPWRLHFERLHRVLGYAALLIGFATIFTGLWAANAPRWMWAVLVLYWSGLLVAALYCQRRGWSYDTYQAIWGPDPELPGNKMPMTGWGTTRPGDTFGQDVKKKKEDTHVRRT